MTPSLHRDEYVIADRLYYRLLGRQQRGDIVAYRYPKAPDYVFIGRVVGLPGEKIEVRDGRVYVDDRPLEESYTISPAA